MAADTTTAAELTQEQVQAILVQPLETASVFLAAGPRIFDTDGSPVRVPKLTSMTTPSWHGENELIDEVDAGFGEITLLPSTLKSVKSLTRFSNELARQSVVALEAALRDRMVRDVASQIDQAFLTGDGGTPSGTEPEGIVNWTGTQELTGVGVIALDDLHDAVGLAMGSNADAERMRWLMPSRDFVNLRKIKDLQDRYQLQPDPTREGAFQLLGLPVTITNRLPIDGGAGSDESEIVLADFSQIAVARDLSPSVKILDQTFGDYDQQAIRVVARYDVASLNPAAVVMLRGITG